MLKQVLQGVTISSPLDRIILGEAFIVALNSMIRFYCYPKDLLVLTFETEGEFFRQVDVECPCNECSLPAEETPLDRVFSEIFNEFGETCELIIDDIAIIKMVTDQVTGGQYIVAVFRDHIYAELFEGEVCIDVDGLDLEVAVNQEFPLDCDKFCECCSL